MQAERVKINKHFFGNIKRGSATAQSISQMGSDSGSDCDSNRVGTRQMKTKLLFLNFKY